MTTEITEITETLPGGYRCTLTARPAERSGYLIVMREVYVPAGCDGPDGDWEWSHGPGPTGATGLEGDRIARSESAWTVGEWDRRIASDRQDSARRAELAAAARIRAWDAAGERVAEKERECAALQSAATALCESHGVTGDDALIYYPQGSGYPSLRCLSGYAYPDEKKSEIRREWGALVDAHRGRA